MNRVWILVVAAALIGLGAFTACGYGHGHGYYGDYYYDDYYYEDCYCDFFGCDCYYYKPGEEPLAGEVW